MLSRLAMAGGRPPHAQKGCTEVQYEVEIGGRVRQVSIRRTNGGFSVGVDGHERAVDAVRIDDHTLSLLMGGASHEVTIVPDQVTGQLSVGIGAVPLSVGLNSSRKWGRKDDGGSARGGPQRVVAPMPGKIARILVKAGEPVSVRQPLVVIEAMKMENELRAAREGVVAQLLVKEGQSVDAGTLLLVVEAE